MLPLTVVIVLTLALGGVVTLALVSRGRPTTAGPWSAEGGQALADEVTSLAGELGVTAERAAAPAATPTPTSLLQPDPEPDPEPAEPPTEVRDADWDVPAEELRRAAARAAATPRPEVSPAEPAAEVALPTYADLARGLAEQGREDEAAIARWAADLREAHLAQGRAAELAGAVEHLDPTTCDDARALLEAVRLAAAEVVDVPSYDASPLDDAATTVPGRHRRPPDPVPHQDPAVLRETARTVADRAMRLATTDAPAARAGVWEADLAAFDAVLIESAHRGGDRRLASVRLRRHLAMSRLQAVTASDDLAATTPTSLPHAVARVRATLSDVLEPHERETLAATFVPWPGDHATHELALGLSA